VLQYHPDKNVDIDDTIFKKITTATNVLSDPKQRRAYDSQDDFDDTIPNGSEGDFYVVFKDAFERFGRWSSIRPLPNIGDDNTPYEEIKKFYDFWFSFKSWRDFSGEDEFDVKEAESRDEKRWMERQNERERRKKKKRRICKNIQTCGYSREIGSKIETKERPNDGRKEEN